jgi:hypothetical protein
MADRTKRGEAEKKREDEILSGEPAKPNPDPAAQPTPQPTRDRGVTPADEADPRDTRDENR